MKKNGFSLLLILLVFLFFGENKNAEAVSVSCGYSPSSVISGKTTSTLQWRASEDVEELVVKCTNYSCSQSGGIGGGALCTYNGSGRGKTYTADEKSKVDGVFKGGFNISPTTWDDKGSGKSETCTFSPYGKNDPFGGRSCTATLSVSSNDDLRCNFSYGPNSVKSGEPVTVSWDFTGAQKVQFSCSNYKCDENRCVYDPNGRSGDNFSSTKDSMRVATWDDLGTGASETCTFTVTGSNGQTKTCGDTLRIEKVNSAKGICGPAARTYYRNDPRGFESYGYTAKSDFCYFGNITNGFSKSSGKYKELSPSEVRFPSENVGEYHYETSYWSCEGPGIEKVNCSANLSSKREAINGECGVAAKNYLEEDGEFFREDTICGDHSKFCRKGTAEPAIINFPRKGQKVQWVCKGANGGSDSPTCTASRIGTSTKEDGKCGNAARTISASQTGYYRDDVFCEKGLSFPAVPPFPSMSGQSASWICDGKDGGAPVTCFAKREDVSGTGGQSGCGPASGIYLYSSSSFREDSGFKFCGSGYNLVGSTPNFPEAGNSSIWQCVSTGRSSNYPITCSAAKRNNSAEMVACGSNATEYEKGTVGWSDQQGSAFCRLGNLSISGYIPMFPTEDQRARSWECESKTNNIDGKKETRKCTATLKDQEGNAPIVGRCGSATTKDYPSVTTEIPNQDLCLGGNPNWQVAFGGENGDQVSWTCKGSALESDSGLCQTKRITSGGIGGDGEETGVEDEEGGNRGGSLACITNPNVSNKSSYSDGKFCLNGQLLSDVKIEQSGDKWLRKWECISNDLKTVKCSSEIGNDGLCGPAAKKYPENVSDFSETFCSNGTFSYGGNTVFTSRTLPKFPKIGESVSWKCLGSDGGKDDNCLATRLQGKPGRCGTNAGKYTHDSKNFRGGEFCSQGKLQGDIPVFPIDPNKKISWICNGIDGGAPTNCTAERVSNPCACATYTKVGTYCGEGINCPGICTHPRCLSGRVID